MGLIEIATDNDSYAYAIFETMNDRGKPLSPVDMLKAYLLAPIEEAHSAAHANQTWKQQVLDLISWGGKHEPERDANCIKAWLRAQYAETTRERKAGAVDKDWELIGSVFHRWVRDHSTRAGPGQGQANQKLMAEKLPVLRQGLPAHPGCQPALHAGPGGRLLQRPQRLHLAEHGAAGAAAGDRRRRDRAAQAGGDRHLPGHLADAPGGELHPGGLFQSSYAMWLLCRDIRRKPLAELVMLARSWPRTT